MSELDDFTAQLNAGGAGGPGGAKKPKLTPEQIAQRQAAMKMKKELDARPLHLTPLKGQVDFKWFGHSGFKISFKDKEDIHRNVYIDIWIDNKDCPEEEKKECPNDADLVLVTHGQLDHSMHAPFLILAGKREDRKIVCSSEVGTYFELFRRIPNTFMAKMNKGGTKDFGFVKITMVSADHSSTCVGPQGVQITGGAACGFIVNIPHLDFTVYHAGDTNVFSDMKIIDDLYQPDIAMLPIGDCLGMGPREAAYALKHFLPTPQVIIPMHFNSFPVLTGTPEEFEKQLKEMGVDDRQVIHPKEFVGGKAIIE